MPATVSKKLRGVPSFIDNWIDYKIINEVDPANFRISPYEFYLYFDV